MIEVLTNAFELTRRTFISRLADEAATQDHDVLLLGAIQQKFYGLFSEVFLLAETLVYRKLSVTLLLVDVEWDWQ